MYKIGDVSKLLNMTSEGLRYYEEYGIITPQKQKGSSMRYYDVWDIHMLVRARAYKRIGFSLRTISELLNGKLRKNLPQLLEEKERELEASIIYSMNLLKRTRQIKEMFRDVERMPGQYRLEHSPDIYRINTQECNRLMGDPSVRSLAEGWIGRAPFVFSSGFFPREELERQGSEYNMGFGIDKEYADYLGVREDAYVVHHPPRMCVYTTLPSHSETLLAPSRLSGAMEYIRENGLRLTGDGFSLIMDFHKDGKVYKNLHRVWLPID